MKNIWSLLNNEFVSWRLIYGFLRGLDRSNPLFNRPISKPAKHARKPSPTRTSNAFRV